MCKLRHVTRDCGNDFKHGTYLYFLLQKWHESKVSYNVCRRFSEQKVAVMAHCNVK